MMLKNFDSYLKLDFTNIFLLGFVLVTLTFFLKYFSRCLHTKKKYQSILRQVKYKINGKGDHFLYHYIVSNPIEDVLKLELINNLDYKTDLSLLSALLLTCDVEHIVKFSLPLERKILIKLFHHMVTMDLDISAKAIIHIAARNNFKATQILFNLNKVEFQSLIRCIFQYCKETNEQGFFINYIMRYMHNRNKIFVTSES